MEYLRDKMPIREGDCWSFFRPLRDSVPFLGAYPGLAPWAVLCRPFGAGVLLGRSVSSFRNAEIAFCTS
jgi:hypothetical protein